MQLVLYLLGFRVVAVLKFVGLMFRGILLLIQFLVTVPFLEDL